MTTISSFLETDHASCDQSLSDVEEAVEREDWARARRLMADFEAALHRHFAMEEEVLFPAFEQATGMTSGPTAVMRAEHRQLRDIVAEASAALQAHDRDGFCAAAETMQILMGQHNLKEEGVLYPAADRMLHARADQLVHAMRTPPSLEGAQA